MITGETAGRISAIVLAAGESRRMGRPKMLLPFREKTMIEQVIAGIRSAGIEKILVVIGAEKEKLSLLLQKISVNFCENINYREGMLSSVMCGVRNLPQETAAMLVFPGDQPLIKPSTTTKVIEKYISSGNGIVIPVYRGRRGHPLLVDRKYFQEIMMLDPSEGLRSLASSHQDDLVEIETDDPGILKDFDTYDEYLDEINQIS
ncbi:MAG TPA: nucleotidyltransferase family protein [Bacteroidales bacterium]|jgi:molybdenum cofactor cytidylyltransferase|nr:nucleotidyltransferase family protein [Bacteroidales bacterium]